MEQSDLDLLQIVPSYHMQVVAKARQIPLDGHEVIGDAPMAADVLAGVAQQLFDNSAIDLTLRDLSEVETRILRELVACGGRANSRELALYFASAGLLVPKKSDEVELPRLSNVVLQYPAAHPHGIFEQALRHLLMLGLLFWGRQTNFAGRDYTSGIHDGVLIVPLTVRNSAQRVWPAEPAAEPSDVSNVSEGALSLQRALYLYWSLVAAQREGLPLVVSGLLARTSLRLVQDQLADKSESGQLRQESEAPRLLFLRLLLLKLGLLQVRHNVLYALPASAFFVLPFIERARRCYHLYLETPFWNEILFLSEINVHPGPSLFDPVHEEVLHARQLVIECLMRERPTQWQDQTVFITHSRLYVPYLLFPRHYGARSERYSSGNNPYGWDFRLRRGWLTHREGWHLVEGGFIRALLDGPLHWLGLVEINRADQTFRLNAGAKALVGTSVSEDEDLAWGKLIVQPSFELLALAPVSEALLLTLDRFAERVNLERVAQYRLTRASVMSAIQKGMFAEQILSELEQAAGSVVPQNVRYTLSEWERQARRVEIWRGATLLEVGDEALLDELCSAEQTHDLFQRRLAPCLVEVAHQRLPEVLQLLWRRDYLPALTTAPQHTDGRWHSREPQWRLQPDGCLQPIYSVPDLYLVEEVARFSERDTVSGWQRLTVSSLRRALEAGIDLEHVVRFLQHYCAGGIPGSLLIRLKLWGGGYASATAIHVERAPLLRLSEQVLRDIQADAEIQQLLGIELAADSRFIPVSPSSLECLLELLRERGFTVE